MSAAAAATKLKWKEDYIQMKTQTGNSASNNTDKKITEVLRSGKSHRHSATWVLKKLLRQIDDKGH